MRNLLKLSISALAVALLAGCGTSPEEARQKLADLNIDYTKESFVEHAERGDMQAVDLFLKAGMDPDHAMPVAVVNDRSQVIQTLKDAGAEPIIPQARPVIAALYAVKKRDVSLFRSAFSEDYLDRTYKNTEKTGRVKRYLKKLRGEISAEELNISNYKFKFMKKNERIKIIYKGEEFNRSPDVIKEDGEWKLDDELY